MKEIKVPITSAPKPKERRKRDRGVLIENEESRTGSVRLIQ